MLTRTHRKDVESQAGPRQAPCRVDQGPQLRLAGRNCEFPRTLVTARRIESVGAVEDQVHMRRPPRGARSHRGLGGSDHTGSLTPNSSAPRHRERGPRATEAGPQRTARGLRPSGKRLACLPPRMAGFCVGEGRVARSRFAAARAQYLKTRTWLVPISHAGLVSYDACRIWGGALRTVGTAGTPHVR